MSAFSSTLEMLAGREVARVPCMHVNLGLLVCLRRHVSLTLQE